MSELDIVPPELEELANEVGDFICYWGFKRIHGRLWTHIYLSRDPLDAGQLMQRLRVSKALISLSLNDLLRYDVILEAGKSARGTQTYAANPDVLDVILNVLRRRERKMLAKTETSHRMLSMLSPESLDRAQLFPERLQSLGRMIEQAQNALGSLLELATVDLTSWEEINESKKSR
ncbi:MAG: GbsR/MarR family transcriptional regulator [Bdellovibrionales bacterium]